MGAPGYEGAGGLVGRWVRIGRVGSTGMDTRARERAYTLTRACAHAHERVRTHIHILQAIAH